MPTPDGLTITTLHGKFVEPNSNGTPLSGTLTFTPTPATITFPMENVIVTGTETAVLDSVTGEFTIDLISTGQVGENPTGWTYSVTEILVGRKQRSYLIALPFTNGVTVELSDITPSEVAPTYIPVVGPVGAPGIVTTVNGHSAATITLTASDLPDLIPLVQKAAINGVATLDANIHVPIAQIPDLSATYVPQVNVEAANGVASLDNLGKVKSTELNLASATPPGIATGGSVGVSTNMARGDHTHAGVDLTSTQSIGGAKTFTSGTQMPQLGVGIAPGTQRAHFVSIVDEIGLQVDQVTVTGNNPLIRASGFDNTMSAFAARVNGDVVDRTVLKTSGNIEFGSGGVARDTTLYRSSSGNLNSGQFNSDAAAPTLASHLTRKDYVDNNFISLAGAQTISGAKTFTSVQTMAGVASTILQQYQVTGDTNNRFQVTTDGNLSFGPGNAAVDVTLSRGSTGSLTLNTSLQSNRAAAANTAFSSSVSGDGFSRFLSKTDGGMSWGTGAATPDTNLYRNGVGSLKTDGNLQIGASLQLAGVNLGETQTYVPTWAGISNQGSGAQKWGYYWQFGHWILALAVIQAGTSPSLGTGTVTVTLPTSCVVLTAFSWLGKGRHNAADGSSWHEGVTYVNSGSSTGTLFGTRQTDLAMVSPGTAGWTFVANSVLEAWFMYPTA